MGCNLTNTDSLLGLDYKPFDLREALDEMIENNDIASYTANLAYMDAIVISKDLRGFPVSAMYAGHNNYFDKEGKFITGNTDGFKYCIEIYYRDENGKNRIDDGMTSYFHLFS